MTDGLYFEGVLINQSSSLDEPAPTVMSVGMGGVGMYQARLVYGEEEHRVGMSSNDGGKPPYAVPSMGEIDKIKKNGLKVISTFTGAGGSCLGFKMAGFETIWASEFVPAAQEVYELNFPGVPVNTGDIRDLSPKDLLDEAGISAGEADVMEGSPPCASFSTAGKREKFWGEKVSYSETTQRVDDLFFEYVRILEGVQPKVFVAENVSGLIKGKSKGYFKEIIRAMKKAVARGRPRPGDRQVERGAFEIGRLCPGRLFLALDELRRLVGGEVNYFMMCATEAGAQTPGTLGSNHVAASQRGPDSRSGLVGGVGRVVSSIPRRVLEPAIF